MQTSVHEHIAAADYDFCLPSALLSSPALFSQAVEAAI